MQSWQPNLILEKYTLNSVPVWVEFWGFPLEYYTVDIVELVGSMVGNVLQVDFSDQGLRNLRYLRVKVELDRSLPLLMGFYVLLDDDRTIWIQCQYERVFHICKQCGYIGHVAKDSMAFHKFKGRRTTKIHVEVEQDSIVYHTHEFRPIRFTRTRSSSSSSSSSPGSNVYRVSDDSSSEPEGYYSDPIGQGSQGGVGSNSPHSSNINAPQSPINWELIAAESARWHPTSEGDPAERGPQEQLMNQINPNPVQSASSMDVTPQAQVAGEGIGPVVKKPRHAPSVPSYDRLANQRVHVEAVPDQPA
ncbi:uncharacterized protein G2W53_008255 [Senna tora]|uniref:DUF4283 domain-containing protein n=1 Tax=Senna tora TaxID=362788 RepID=A0A834X9V2_9FABA|nr:uncharacterized protein G2W53_008255 [Senna tora]